jgi:GDPmannose 4,6-dehydratase
MTNKKALITGVAGQDGSYLSEYLLNMGYEVHGIVRRNSVAENQNYRLYNIPVTTHYGDVTDPLSLDRIFKEVEPDEVYNLAAQSHVRVSFDLPTFTLNNNVIGTLNVLEATKNLKNSKVKYYQASSSEMFGNCIDSDLYQRKTTTMSPTSPYGCAKVMGYNLTRHYRSAYDIHACNGIMFNHESPRRGSNFVTNKIVKGAVEIKKGLRKSLSLGNLEASRDWGHSKDYVRAMHLLLNYSEPSDWVVATGESRTIREMCKVTFDLLGLDYEEHIIVDPKYFRPQELNFLRGDSSEIREKLGWKPEYTFEKMVEEMVNHWLEK